MTTQLQVITPGQTRTRKNRTPSFPIAGQVRPFGLYPLFVHPVLPGGTLEHATMKIRALSRPVKHPLAGAWMETWLCYVKFTDLDRNLGDMFVTDGFSTAGHTAAANNERYFVRTGQIAWVQKCVERIHEAYFRHDQESMRTIDSVPQVKLNASSWYQNAIYTEAATALGANVATVEGQLNAFEMMRHMAMTELTYERYLQQYGVQSVRTGIGEPEILRYARSWVMPVNTVEATTGAPSSAWVWSDEITLDKPKLFQEPGFVIALACVRPKMYAKNIQSSMVGTLWGFSDWFPAYNLDTPEAGARPVTVADALVSGATQELIVDYRDLLSHGEQFINCRTSVAYPYPEATTPVHTAAQQPEDLRGEYCTSADVDALFVGGTADLRCVYYDGMAQLRVRGHITETTPVPR